MADPFSPVGAPMPPVPDRDPDSGEVPAAVSGKGRAGIRGSLAVFATCAALLALGGVLIARNIFSDRGAPAAPQVDDRALILSVSPEAVSGEDQAAYRAALGRLAVPAQEVRFDGACAADPVAARVAPGTEVRLVNTDAASPREVRVGAIISVITGSGANTIVPFFPPGTDALGVYCDGGDTPSAVFVRDSGW